MYEVLCIHCFASDLSFWLQCFVKEDDFNRDNFGAKYCKLTASQLSVSLSSDNIFF